MSNLRQEPNPLRPYHVHQPPRPTVNISGNGPSTAAAKGASQPSASKTSLGSSARDMLSDLDYGDYIPGASPSVTEVIRGLVDQGVWKYTSILFAQPFDVAKTVLQVQDAGAVVDKRNSRETMSRLTSNGTEPYNALSDDSDNDSQSYFTSAAPRAQSHRASRRRFTSRSRSPASSYSRRSARSPPATQPHTYALSSTSSLSTVLSAVWKQEGAWGVWKGTNSTFIHSILLTTISSFIRSLFCAVLDLPDPTLTTSALPTPSSLTRLDILTSPSPLLSLASSLLASAISGILLAPIDLARTVLLLTPSTHPPRSLIPMLKTLPSWIIPASLIPATILHSTISTLISASTPLFLRSRLGLDPIITPTAYAAATFLSQVFELGIRLPIETVLRRGQLAIASTSSPATPSGTRFARTPSLQTVVDVGPYKGLFGTMYHIVFEEGTRGEHVSGANALPRSTGKASSVKAQPLQGRRRKGQGLEGLWRGWRIGVWGLVGAWGAGIMGGGPAGRGGEF